MPMINIEDAYILDETGAQVDKVTGLFTKDEVTTSGEKAFAQLNIGTAGSNRNLLDNGWWLRPINQRSAASLPNNAYGIDRWKGENGSGASVTVTSDGLVFDPGSGTANAWQPLEASLRAWMVGKKITVSILKGDGTIISGTDTYTAGTSTYFITRVQSGGVECFISPGGNFNCRAASSYTIAAIKMELGSVSTLANDVPPEYKTELDKCQYRCVVYNLPSNFLFCRGIATNSTNIRGIIDLPTSMAGDRTPTISLTGSLTTPQGNTITSITAANMARNNKLAVNCTVSSVTSGSVYDIFTGSATPKIVISADL